MERLQRVLAARGVASRRKAEELILQGRVRVDGKIVRELGVRVDPERQKIEVDGKLLPIFRHRYILLNKPSGYITTTSDERDRLTVMDLVQVSEPVVPVGRLDRPTEGLLLLTNDGDVAYRVTHPRFGIEKEYEALLDGHPPPVVLERVRRGIVVDGERVTPVLVRPIRILDEGTLVRIVIHEGRNRIVRRMFEEVGYPVIKLVRTRIGPLQLGSIPRGAWRDLTDGELEQLREALHLRDEDTGFSEPSTRPRPSPAVRDQSVPRGGRTQPFTQRQPVASHPREGDTRRGGRPATDRPAERPRAPHERPAAAVDQRAGSRPAQRRSAGMQPRAGGGPVRQGRSGAASERQPQREPAAAERENRPRPGQRGVPSDVQRDRRVREREIQRARQADDQRPAGRRRSPASPSRQRQRDDSTPRAKERNVRPPATDGRGAVSRGGRPSGENRRSGRSAPKPRTSPRTVVRRRGAGPTSDAGDQGEHDRGGGALRDSD